MLTTKKKRREVDLPPAGHRRDEELRRRTDRLEEKADKANSQIEAGAGDLRNYEVENEIAQHMDEQGQIVLSGLNTGYVYAMVSEDYPTNAKGINIQRKLMMRGWEVVTGDMPESKDPGNKYIRDVRGYLKVGCSILMRCRKDLAKKHLLADRELRRKYYESESGGFTNALAQAKRAGLAIEIDPSDPKFDQAMKRAVADQLSTKKFTELLKEGRVPGREIQQ